MSNFWSLLTKENEFSIVEESWEYNPNSNNNNNNNNDNIFFLN